MQWPTIRELLEAKKAGKVITVGIPKGSVRLCIYINAWKTMKTLSPSDQIKGWNYEAYTVAEIMRELRRGVQDRINQRGGLVMREWPEKRLWAVRNARINHKCRNCEMKLGGWKPEHMRFCSDSCRRSYY